MSDFKLHPRLRADTTLIASLGLSEWLLMNERRYLWTILVPRVEDCLDMHHLPHPDQATLWQEIQRVSMVVESVAAPFKLNVAALGNQVPQLHVHVIARNHNDPAWPDPVWGHSPPEAYAATAREEAIVNLLTTLASKP
ncbi:MAG: HIT family protein [Pseudomonadota bacterium]